MPSEQAEAVFAALRTTTVVRYRWIQCVDSVDRGMNVAVKPAPEIEAGELHEKPVILDPWGHCNCGGIVGPHLRGVFYNHPYVPDGEWGHTSPLITITGSVAVCNSRVYHLGKLRA